MKIGTMTFHAADNQGAMLQAYALVIFLAHMRYECEIVDFRVPEVSYGISVEWPKELIKEYGWFRGIIKSANRQFRGYYSKKNKLVNYSRFARKYLPISATTYKNNQELFMADYDAIIFGSDQIWNPELLNKNMASCYFGDFETQKKYKKIAYAASSGKNELHYYSKEQLLKWLSDFQDISVREKGLAESIRNEYGIVAETVVDPVFLIDSASWRKLESKLPKSIKPNEYIFVYTFDEQDVYDYARTVSKATGLPIVALRWCGKTDRLSDMIQLYSSGPDEFLSLIDNAAIVCTSSFHGLAFSLIFEKEFYCCSPEGFGSRTDNLLDIAGLTERKVNGNSEYKKTTVDYFKVRENIGKHREKSIEFLKQAISKI